jgi:hypothetical protein
LDAVLKEQAFSASGLVDETAARKIGELAPIDFILTGTFTRLERSIVINLRFIDVVSGEVRGNISESLELTSDMAALFEDLQILPVVPPIIQSKDQVSPCDPKWTLIKKSMEDIGTPKKVDKLVESATAIPFEPPCGDIHYNVISLLTDHKKYQPRYSQFLLEILRKIDNPHADRRTGAIIKYLFIPGQLDDPAWNATFRVAGLSENFNAYLTVLLADDLRTEASRRLLQERIGIIMTEVDRKRIGRPVPVETGNTFEELLSTLQSNYIGSYVKTEDLRPLINCYQSFGSKYINKPTKKLLEILMAMYDSAKTGNDRELILEWVCERINQFPPSRDLEDILVPFINKLFESRKTALKTEPTGGIPARDLKRIASLSGKRIAETIPFIMGRDSRLDIIGFCLENDIKVPGIVPNLKTLERDLSSESYEAQSEAIRLMKHLGPAALPSEPAILKQLRRCVHKNDIDGQNKYLQHGLVGLLGTIQTRNPEAHRLLINQLMNIEPYIADEAVLALVNIGEPAAGALKAEFPKISEAYKQIRVIKVFQLRGKAAAKHLHWLKLILDSTKSPHVRDAAEDAIDAIAKS